MKRTPLSCFTVLLRVLRNTGRSSRPFFNGLLTEIRPGLSGSANAAKGEDAPAPIIGASCSATKGQAILSLSVDPPAYGAHGSIMGWGWWLLYAGLTFGGIAIVLFIQRR